MAVNVSERLRSPSFDRDTCVKLLQKWAPYYFDGPVYAAFLECAIDLCRVRSGVVLFNVVSRTGSVRALYVQDTSAAFRALLWGRHSSWLDKIASMAQNDTIPSFIRRAVELSLPVQETHNGRRAVQCILDMGHYKDAEYSQRSKGVLVHVKTDTGRDAYGDVIPSTAACLAVAAWWYVRDGTKSMLSTDAVRDIKELHSKLVVSLVDGTGDDDVHDIRRLLCDGLPVSTVSGRVFLDASHFFGELCIRDEDCVCIGLRESIACKMALSEREADATLHAWRLYLGDDVRAEYTGGDLRVPEETQRRVQRYLVPYMCMLGYCKNDTPLYPMLARSYLQALADNDARGMTLVVRSIICMIVDNYRPVVVTENTLHIYAMLPMYMGIFGDGLWNMLSGPYLDPGGVETRARKDAPDEESILGFGQDTANIYTGLLAFLDIERPHMIAAIVLRRLVSFFAANLEMQHTYPYPWWLLFNLYETAFVRPCQHGEDPVHPGAFVPIPTAISGASVSPVEALYMLVLCREMPLELSCMLFMGMRVVQPEQSTEGCYQTLPPCRAHSACMERYLAARDDRNAPPVYDICGGAPLHMREFVYVLAYIELMGHFPTDDGQEMRRLAQCISAGGRVQRASNGSAGSSTYRGAVKPIDLLPYTVPTLEADVLHRMVSVNDWQGSVLPVFGPRRAPIVDRRSCLYGVHPELYDCIARTQLTCVATRRVDAAPSQI